MPKGCFIVVAKPDVFMAFPRPTLMQERPDASCSSEIICAGRPGRAE
jgi:hypothetical protein